MKAATMICGISLAMLLLFQFSSGTPSWYNSYHNAKHVYPRPRPPARKCDRHPCQNGGRCIEKPAAPDGYLCNCPYDYSGSSCERWVGRPFHCAGIGNRPDPKICPSTAFYSCVGSAGWLMRCDIGTWYNPASKRCDWKHEVRCY
jgi:hypothetical protein